MKVRLVQNIGLTLATFCVLLLVLWLVTKQALWGGLVLVFALLMVAVTLLLGRCPSCNKWLGFYIYKQNCKHCEADLDR